MADSWAEIEHSYATEVDQQRRLCDPKPTVLVRLVETVTTTTCLDDGSVTVNSTQPRVVATWTYAP